MQPRIGYSFLLMRKMQQEQWKREFDAIKEVAEAQKNNDFDSKQLEELWAQVLQHTEPIAAPEQTYQFHSPVENYPFDAFAEAKRLFAEGKITEAIVMGEAAVKKDLANADCWLFLGECNAENENEGQAIVAYNECLKIDSKNLKALQNLAISLTNNGSIAEASEILLNWIKIAYPEESLGSETIESAIESCGKHPDDSNLALTLGMRFYHRNQYEEALKCFRAAISASPGEYVLWNTIGATLANSGKNEEAVQAYREAIIARPSFVRARNNLAIGCIQIGCYEQALEQLSKALSIQFSLQDVAHTSDMLWETIRRCAVQMQCDRALDACNRKDVSFFTNKQWHSP